MSTKKQYNVVGIGNAIVDILVKITEEQFKPLGYTKATMQLTDVTTQSDLLVRVGARSSTLMSGGSVANSTIAVAQLGGKAAFESVVGDDDYGRHYAKELKDIGITFSTTPVKGATSGTSVILITPDSERTMRTSLGISGQHSVEHVQVEHLASTEWAFLEGYLLTNGDRGRKVYQTVAETTKKHGGKVALTLSEVFIAQSYGDFLASFLPSVDLVFANEGEALAYTKAATAHAAFDALCAVVPHVVVTRGSHGALIGWKGERFEVPSFPCTPVDLTGAGDMFAGSFLYGITHGIAPDVSARAACFLAVKVITQIGARLTGDIKSHWDTIVRG